MTILALAPDEALIAPVPHLRRPRVLVDVNVGKSRKERDQDIGHLIPLSQEQRAFQRVGCVVQPFPLPLEAIGFEEIVSLFPSGYRLFDTLAQAAQGKDDQGGEVWWTT